MLCLCPLLITFTTIVAEPFLSPRLFSLFFSLRLLVHLPAEVLGCKAVGGILRQNW